MNRTILLASNNQGKLKEISALLQHIDLHLVIPSDIGLVLNVSEDGQTYEENALLKALAFCQASGLPSLADDTGLEVEALNGAPGLHSARFVQTPNASDADRRQYLLECLRGKEKPWRARFVCVVVLAVPDGNIISANGCCEGEITEQERGNSGFGYDHVFLFPSKNKTMAELGMQEKNKISHRARAVKKIIPDLKSLVK